jgi:succinate dehydrogenase/fumarate reductase flavoprotein subunit
MRWKPVVVQSERSDGSLLVTVGHPLVDAYLEFLSARARPNTIRAVAFDLKVFFSFVDITPTRVTARHVMSFISAQRGGDGHGNVVQIDRSERLSPRTIRRRLSSVSGFYAVSDGARRHVGDAQSCAAWSGHASRTLGAASTRPAGSRAHDVAEGVVPE